MLSNSKISFLANLKNDIKNDLKNMFWHFIKSFQVTSFVRSNAANYLKISNFDGLVLFLCFNIQLKKLKYVIFFRLTWSFILFGLVFPLMTDMFW